MSLIAVSCPALQSLAGKHCLARVRSGVYLNGSFSLNNIALSDQLQTGATLSETSTNNASYTGTNSGLSYTGTSTDTATLYQGGTDSCTLSQAGQYTSGTLTLSSMQYQASVNQSFSRTDASQSNWTGSYNGSDSATLTATGLGSANVYASGGYSGGSYGLSDGPR